MWLTKKLSGEAAGAKVSSGQVAGGDSFAVRGENEYQRPETLFPYGFSSLAEEGGKAVLIDGFCAGVAQLPDGDLGRGEVRLYSAGGAEILLKNDGSVVINGQVIAAQ